MNPLRLVGHVLLWIGFFAGAFLAVRNVEIAGDKWSTIQWPLYVAALLTGFIGVALLRITQQQESTHSDKLASDIKIIDVSLRELLAKLTVMREQRDATDVFAVHKLIDARLMENVADFVEARKTLIHTYGLQPYAELMTHFSIGERNLNRAWSASADGYVDEVWASLSRAEDELQNVSSRLAQLKKDHQWDLPGNPAVP